MEASALQAPAAIARTRISLGAPLLRLRSDEQLVSLFRSGNDEAFRVIHDRYRQRLFAYTRQMLPGSRQDAEDALQDIFVRAYAGLRANDRELALRAWLYRVAHNRCIDELRRPLPPAPEVFGLVRPPDHDPIEEAERRESLRRLVADVRRLPEQQRSALLMRELGGMSYADLAVTLGVSVPAVKSLLVRARVGLAHALEARDVACAHIREELIGSHDRGVRPSGIARRHMHDCRGCREFRGQMRGVSRDLAALVPALGPLGVICHALGIGSGAASGGAVGSGGAAAAAGGAASTGAVASAGVFATGAGHVATLLAAAVVTAGGAAEIQRTIAPAVHHRTAHHATIGPGTASSAPSSPASAATIAAPAAANPVGPPVSSPATKPTPPPAGGAGVAPSQASAASSTATPTAPGVNELDPAANGPTGTTNATGATPVPGATSATSAPGADTTAGGTGAAGGSSAGGSTAPRSPGSNGAVVGGSTQSPSGGTSSGSTPVSPIPVPAAAGPGPAAAGGQSGSGNLGGGP